MSAPVEATPDLDQKTEESSTQMEPIPHERWLRKLPPPPPTTTPQEPAWYETHLFENPNDPLSPNFQGHDPDQGLVFHGFETPAASPAPK